MATAGLWLSILYASRKVELKVKPATRVTTTLSE